MYFRELFLETCIKSSLFEGFYISSYITWRDESIFIRKSSFIGLNPLSKSFGETVFCIGNENIICFHFLLVIFINYFNASTGSSLDARIAG